MAFFKPVPRRTVGQPGPPGGVGPQGEPGEPGADGAPGPAGAAGSDGPPGPPGLDAEEPEIPWTIPGPVGDTGPAGTTGPAGEPGAQGPPGLDAEEAEIPWTIPGEPGARGATGGTGPAGAAGAAGPMGPPGIDAEEPELPYIIPGERGATGATGAPGSGGVTLISGNSGAAPSGAAPTETWQVLTSNAAANLTTTIAVVMTTTAVPAGTWRFRYDIIGQSATATVSLKFSVNHSGTTSTFVYRLFFPSQGVTAATGIIDQETNATTGFVYAQCSTRVKNTTLGPFTDVDTINADLHFVIEGLFISSTSGNLTLGHASETATSTQVMAGTCLRLDRLA